MYMYNNISKVRIYFMIRDLNRTLAVDFEDNKHENQESSILLNVIISLYVSRTSNQIYFFLVFFFEFLLQDKGKSYCTTC